MNIPEKPYNVWLEKTIRHLYEEDVECVGITFRRKDGSSVVAYYNSTAEDKARMAYHYIADAMMDIVLANVDLIKKAAEEQEEENGTEI